MRNNLRRMTGSCGAEGSPMLDPMLPLTRARPGLRAGPPKVLVILGHPRPDSFCKALADAYVTGAQEAGAEVRRLSLTELGFELNVLVPSPRDQLLEPGISDSVGLVAWAEHLVFVFPTWWGTMPACLKGFLDRVLMPGFAFADREDGEGWDKLLVGKTAHLLTTMDTPPGSIDGSIALRV
jgi:1,4-dihydroxy-2-naphthoate polyprenyltransferase